MGLIGDGVSGSGVQGFGFWIEEYDVLGFRRFGFCVRDLSRGSGFRDFG